MTLTESEFNWFFEYLDKHTGKSLDIVLKSIESGLEIGQAMKKLTLDEIKSQQSLRVNKPQVYEKCIRFDDQLAEGKSIALIQLQYKYACNFKCSHCSISGFRSKAYERKLDIPTVKRVFDEAHEYGLAHMGLSGGEPLVFPDLEELIEAVGPERFHIQLDTNGLLFDRRTAFHMKSLGVDKVQISIDGLYSDDHDAFRNHKGSHLKCLEAIHHARDVGLQVQVATVVWHERAQSKEFETFLKVMALNGAPVSVIYAKPVGEFADNYEGLCTPQDIAHVKRLLKKYGGYDHTSPNYGRDLGCVAVKRVISLTASGEILPCPWMYWTLGNIFDTPLADILAKGMRYFGERNPVCRLSEDREFAKKYAHLGSDDLPPIEEVMGERL